MTADYGVVLENIRKLLAEDEETEVQLVRAGEQDAEYDVLTMLLRSFGTIDNLAEGEFFFAERGGKDFFNALIYVMTEIPAQVVPDLCTRIGILNPELAAGSFAYDPYENAIVYAVRIPVAEGLEEAPLTELADGCIASAITLAEQAAGELIAVAAGENDEI